MHNSLAKPDAKRDVALHKISRNGDKTMTNSHAHSMASFGTPVSNTGAMAFLTQRYRAFRIQQTERARIRRELESYSDRQLLDLGISRADIPSVAAGEYAR